MALSIPVLHYSDGVYLCATVQTEYRHHICKLLYKHPQVVCLVSLKMPAIEWHR